MPVPRQKSSADGYLFFMRKKSKICHFRRRELSRGGGANFFECGRMLSDKFDAIPSIATNSFRFYLLRFWHDMIDEI